MGFPRELLFLQWVEIGRRVRVHANASLWWLGDWLLYGERAYGGRYKRGIELTGLEYQTLRNYAAVARRFDRSRRRDKLSFQHHAEVCALPDDEQDRWLYEAEAAGWSRNELRRRLRNAGTCERTRISTTLRLAADPARTARWRRAAALSHSKLDAWIVGTLDEAADGLLGERR